MKWGIEMNRSDALSYDPYNPEIAADPYPVYRRLREEAPLYFNSQYEFYAVSRFDDVQQAFRDRETFSSARGAVLEVIKANPAIPPAVLLFQDPPIHTVYRNLLQLMFNPRRMTALKLQVRDYCIECLEPFVGGGGFDFVADIGAKIPMRVIGMLLGIPEQDHEAVRQFANTRMRTETGKPMDVADRVYDGAAFEEYVDWRIRNPAADVMTELLNTEFIDEAGAARTLTRAEVLTLVSILAGAGNETTNRLIGWTGKVLGEHPDQRRQVVQNPELVPQTVEEVLRFEPPTPHVARYVTRDVEIRGRTVPEGSAMITLSGAANHDDRQFADGDKFDINRERRAHLTFGYGIHTCIGAVLARLEGCIVLEEILKRFPDWEVDLDRAEQSSSSAVRGWDRMPVLLPGGVRKATRTSVAAADTRSVCTAVSIDGVWTVVTKSPAGAKTSTLVLEYIDGALSGTQTGRDGTSTLKDVKFDGKDISWSNSVSKPIQVNVVFTGTLDGDTIIGKAKAGFMGTFSFTATRNQAGVQ